MDPMLVATIIGSIAAVAAAIIAWITYRHSQTQQSPALRVDEISLGVDKRPQGDSVPKWVELTITNTSDGLAKDLDVSAWIFMVQEQEFTVPPDDALGRPQYTAHITSLKSGETMRVTALRSNLALVEQAIPSFNPDVVPLVKVTLNFRDQFRRDFVERTAMVGTPVGYEIVGYDHSPD